MILLGDDTLVVEPIAGDGQAKGGLVIQFHKTLPKMLAKVISVPDSCNYIYPGDVVLHRPNAVWTVMNPDPTYLLTIGEVAAILQDYYYYDYYSDCYYEQEPA